MNPILIFLVLVSLFARGAVAGETVVVGQTSLPTLPTTIPAHVGQTFGVSIPRCPTEVNGQRVYLERVDVSFDGVLLTGGVTVQNTGSQPMGWGVYGYGCRLVLANGAYTGSPDQWSVQGPPLFASCAWDRLAPGESKTYFPGAAQVGPSRDYVGSVERGWQGAGSRLLTCTLTEASFSKGLSSHWSASNALALGVVPWTNAVVVRYTWTTTPPTERTRFVEGPWAQSEVPNDNGDESLAWIAIPSGACDRAFFEQASFTQVDLGVENLGASSAVCGGDMQAGVLLWTPFHGLSWSTWTNIGTVNTALASFDGASDWRGSSGFLSLPSYPLSAGSGAWPDIDASPYGNGGYFELRSALWFADWRPTPVTPGATFAWAGDCAQFSCVRIVKVR